MSFNHTGGSGSSPTSRTLQHQTLLDTTAPGAYPNASATTPLYPQPLNYRPTLLPTAASQRQQASEPRYQSTLSEALTLAQPDGGGTEYLEHTGEQPDPTHLTVCENVASAPVTTRKAYRIDTDTASLLDHDSLYTQKLETHGKIITTSFLLSSNVHQRTHTHSRTLSISRYSNRQVLQFMNNVFMQSFPVLL